MSALPYWDQSDVDASPAMPGCLPVTAYDLIYNPRINLRQSESATTIYGV
jgi:hypothetical protein